MPIVLEPAEHYGCNNWGRQVEFVVDDDNVCRPFVGCAAAAECTRNDRGVIGPHDDGRAISMRVPGAIVLLPRQERLHASPTPHGRFFIEFL